MVVTSVLPTSRQAIRALLEAPSFELVPLRGALEQAEALPAGSTVTVTSSPSRGLEPTIALAEALAARGFRAVPHLAARQFHDEAEVAATLQRLDRAEIRNVFVVGGDSAEPAGAFPDGLSLLTIMTRLGAGFDSVGVPSYPEGHHTIGDDTLLSALEAKQRYATYTVTQLCFDPEAICRFAASLGTRGIKLPVLVGIPGAVDTARLLRIGLQVGVGDSLRFVRGNGSVGRLLRPNGYRPDRLVQRLSARIRDGRCDLTGLHIYTFNQVGPTVRWLERGVR